MLQYRIHDANWVTMHKDDPEFRKSCRDAYLPWDEIRAGDEIWMIDNGKDDARIALVRDGWIVRMID